jgi:hypothetical protein
MNTEQFFQQLETRIAQIRSALPPVLQSLVRRRANERRSPRLTRRITTIT